MEKAWEEIILQQEERPIALSLVPEEKKRTGLLSMVLPSGTDVYKRQISHSLTADHQLSGIRSLIGFSKLIAP